MEKNLFEVVVTDCDEEINSLDLSNFILQFRRNYIAAFAFVQFHNSWDERNKNFVGNISEGKSIESLEIEFASIFSEFRNTIGKYDHVFSYNKKLPPEIELNFSNITKNSPLAFMGYCTGVGILALALAVALAGGEADLTNNKFKVNSLLDAIRKWRR
jgi:hypothetical protein